MRESVSIVTKCSSKHTSEFKPRTQCWLYKGHWGMLSGMNIMQNSEGRWRLSSNLFLMILFLFLRVVCEEFHSSSGPYTTFQHRTLTSSNVDKPWVREHAVLPLFHFCLRVRRPPATLMLRLFVKHQNWSVCSVIVLPARIRGAVNRRCGVSFIQKQIIALCCSDAISRETVQGDLKN